MNAVKTSALFVAGDYIELQSAVFVLVVHHSTATRKNIPTPAAAGASLYALCPGVRKISKLSIYPVCALTCSNAADCLGITTP